MRSTFSRLTILSLVLILGGGGPAAGALRALLAPSSRATPIYEEEEHRAKEHGYRAMVASRRASPHVCHTPGTGRCAIPPGDAPVARLQSSPAWHWCDAAVDLRNGIGTALRC